MRVLHKCQKPYPIFKQSYPICRVSLMMAICCLIETYKDLYPIMHATFGEKAFCVVTLQSQTQLKTSFACGEKNNY